MTSKIEFYRILFGLTKLVEISERDSTASPSLFFSEGDGYNFLDDGSPSFRNLSSDLKIGVRAKEYNNARILLYILEMLFDRNAHEILKCFRKDYNYIDQSGKLLFSLDDFNINNCTQSLFPLTNYPDLPGTFEIIRNMYQEVDLSISHFIKEVVGFRDYRDIDIWDLKEVRSELQDRFLVEKIKPFDN